MQSPATRKFRLTPKQAEVQSEFSKGARHVLLVGGSRSGKSFLIIRNIVLRALKANNSRHVVFRLRFNAVKSSIVLDTFPKVMRIAFPGVQYRLDKTDWYAEFPNGSQFWFAGLDDKERTEKILGMEFATIFLNECSQIPYSSRNMALTRLAQQCEQRIGDTVKPLPVRMYYDENPPSKAHWTYQIFVKKTDPDTRKALVDADQYAHAFIQPHDNADNVSADYLQTLEALPARLRVRFLEGKFAEELPGQLFTEEIIETWRVTDGDIPDLVRVVIAVDPSGSGDEDNADNDEIGIAVGGLGTDGNVYVLEDCSVKAGPATWGKVAVSAYHRNDGDCIVGEINFGGAMVGHVIKTTDAKVPFVQVTASRGKVQRAEPFSAMYEQGKVRHVGRFVELETELAAFTTHGYVGGASPNRADALIWMLAALFPSVVRPSRKAAPVPVQPQAHRW